MIEPKDGYLGHGMTIRHPIRPRVQRTSFQRWMRTVDRLNPIFGVVFTGGIFVGMVIQLLIRWVFA